MTPAAQVLNTMQTQPDRWSLVPHRNDDPDHVKLAVEIIERLLPARHNTQLTLAGRPLPWDEFPLTMSFIVKAAAVLGVRLGQKRAYQVRREALTLLQHCGKFARRARYALTLFQLRRYSATTPISPTTTRDFLSAKTGCQAPTRTASEECGRYDRA